MAPRRLTALRLPRLRTLIVTPLLAVAIAACGSPTDPMTDADVQAFKGFSTSYQQVAGEMLELSTAVAQDRIPAARASLTALGPELDATDAKVSAIRNRTVRLTLQDYMRISRRAVASIDKLVAHLEATPDAVPSRDLLAEIESSNAELKEADGKLIERILDQAASDEQKDAINRAITIQP